MHISVWECKCYIFSCGQSLKQCSRSDDVIKGAFVSKFIWVVMISGKDDVELAKCHFNVTGKGQVSVVWVELGVKWL